MAVEDTLEGLRGQVEELTELLAARAPADSTTEPGAEGPLELEAAMAGLAKRLDQAGELLAMLTDLLEAQAERLEWLEQRVERLDDAPSPAAQADPEPSVDTVSEGLEALVREQAIANRRLAAIEARLAAMAEGEVDRADKGPSETEEASGASAAGDHSDGRLSLARMAEREIEGRRVAPPKSHPTVLVVDDLAEARTLLSIYLSKTGYQVVTASSAEDCLAKLLHHEVDAIVLDAELNGADGGHVLKVMREDEGYQAKRAVPVIVYTAYPERVGRDLADAWGAAEYVVKGGDMLPLMTALIRHTSPTERQFPT